MSKRKNKFDNPIKMLIFFIFLLQFPVSHSFAADPFGTIIGTFNNVPAYSNCSNLCTSCNNNCQSYNYIDGNYIGIKWQCVEYVRRYYYEVYNMDLAALYRGDANTFYDNADNMGLESYANGGATAPSVGDILVSNGGGDGHVAIIKSVTNSQVCTIQQNFSNDVNDDDRCLTLTETNGNYNVNGFSTSYPIQGWLRVPQLCSDIPANQSLARIEGQGTTYWIQNGIKYYITNPTVFSDMLGIPGWGHICDFTAETLDSFISGADFIGISSTSDDLLIKLINDSKVYLIEGGQRRWITSETAFNNLGLDWGDIITVSQNIIDMFPEGDNISTNTDDTAPPELVAINLTPANIDVTSGSATVTLTATITDNLSGFDYGYFYIYSASNAQYKYVYINQTKRISGTGLNGQYETTITFPQFSEAGDWTIKTVRLYDKTTNRQDYYGTDLDGLGTTTVYVTSDEDITSPIITNIEIAPAAIDASTGDASITLTTSITDDLAGFNYAYFYFYSASNNQYRTAYVSNRISGDSFDGTYQETVTFPQYSEAGDWRIKYVYLYDKASNEWYHSEQDLIDMGLAISFAMIADPQDIQAPVPADFDFSPEVVNTILSPASTTFSMNLTDNLSGFSSGRIQATSPSGGQNHYMWFSSYNRISGDELNGEYQITKEFPRYSEFGEWKINSLYLWDRTTNRTYYSTQDLEALGFPVTIKMEGIIDSDNYIIGADGGTIETDDGILTVEFPANALSEDTEISIASVGRFDPVNIRIGDGPGLGNTIAEYDFQPDGLIFSEPVTVTMTVDVTGLNQNQRDRLNMYLYTDTDADGTLDTFIPLSPEQIVSITTTINTDETVVMTFVIQLEHFSTYAVILPIEDLDTTAPDVQITVPQADEVIQDGATLVAEVTDQSSIDFVHFTIREADGNGGVIIGYENIPATQKAGTDSWELGFDSVQLLDGHYILSVKAVDEYGNEGTSSVVPFSIRNWAVMELLPASKVYRAGRTMPVKFALRIAESVNPNTPFVRNEELEIRICETSDPDNILQSSLFGDKATDYRINSDTELYITNFKTSKTPTEYTVEIWRAAKEFLIGSFTFETTGK